MNTLLPIGHHWGLNIEHHLITTGPFTGGGHKMLWHTTEGAGFDGADSTLRQNGDQPHFLLDTHTGRCRQYVGLNQYSKSLAHPAGTPETNRANVIQVELVGFASEVHAWSGAQLKRIAALACLVDHRFSIPRVAPKPFVVGNRFTGPGFVSARGHVGHMHAPNNDHNDPGHLDIHRVFDLMHTLDASSGK